MPSTPESLPRAKLKELTRAGAGAEILGDPAQCLTYAYDNSRRSVIPAAVALPRSHEQVAGLVAYCYAERLPVTVRGRGTNTVGAAVPVAGGLVLSLERMNQILECSVADRYLIAQAGATNGQVQRHAAELGFFWAPDPTSSEFSTVGGNLACNAGGPRAVKYGTCRENTLGLRAITGIGATLNTGSRTTKGVVGYDLTRLLVGSEGGLAIISEATLRLTPLPTAKRTLRACYRDIESAAAAVARIMAQPELPCALEFMDAAAVSLVRDQPGVDLPAATGALLILEADGSASDIAAGVNCLQTAAAGDGLLDFRVARTADEVSALWQARKALSPALRRLAPKKLNEDVVVPVSALPRLVRGLQDLSHQHGVPIVNFGHAGNGNVHVNLLADDQNQDQMDALEPCLSAVFDLVLSLHGTLSGEHGTGLEKLPYLPRELDPESIRLMHGIKAAFDPRGILNPGKLPELAPVRAT